MVGNSLQLWGLFTMRMRRNGVKPNAVFIAELVDFSKSGALMLVFVIEAIRHYASSTISAEPWKQENGLVKQDA